MLSARNQTPRLHAAWFHLYGNLENDNMAILQKAEPGGQKTDPWFLGAGGQGRGRQQKGDGDLWAE